MARPHTIVAATPSQPVFTPVVFPKSFRARADDRRLARRLARRDADALREVYDRYARTTFGLLVHMLRNPATAEDVQQQVFLEVWQRAGSYDPERASMATWILTIARSRAIDELRRKVPEPRDPGGAVAVLDSAQRIEAGELDALLERWRLVHLLERLPAAEADLLRRRFYRGQSQTEIAAETGIPLGTVKARMISGLERLRTLIESEPA